MPPRQRETSSWVWGPGKFHKSPGTKPHTTKATCTVLNEDGTTCGKVYDNRAVGTGSGSLKSHLENTHNMKECDISAQPQVCRPPNQSKICDYFPAIDLSYEATISRMVAVDNMTLSFFVTSEDMRRFLRSTYHTELHSSANSIRKVLFSYRYKVSQ